MMKFKIQINPSYYNKDQTFEIRKHLGTGKWQIFSGKLDKIPIFGTLKLSKDYLIRKGLMKENEVLLRKEQGAEGVEE